MDIVLEHQRRVILGSKLNLSPEIKAYISGLTTPLSYEQVTKLDTFVKALKTGLGISALSDAFDVMYILAGETAESSLKNLVKNAHHATAVNSPAFTDFEGFQGNGVSTYIDTNYVQKKHQTTCNYLDSAIGHYARKNIGSLGEYIWGAGDPATYDGSFCVPKQTTSVGRAGVYRLRNLSESNYLNSNNSAGFYVFSRNSITNLRVYYNATVISDNTSTASATVTDKSITLLALNDTNNGVTNYCQEQMSFFFIGKKQDNIKVTVITNAFESYMDSNGKGVIS